MDFILLAGCFLVTFIVLSYLFAYIFHSMPFECPSSERIDGKTVLITGGSDGIGFETALELARRGAIVIIASRQWHKGKAAVQRIINETGNVNVSFEQVDLADWNSVYTLANRIRSTHSQLNILINNAGIAGSTDPKDELRETAANTYDRVFAVNYLSHFLLTHLLLPLLIQSAPSRIISVISMAHSYVREPLIDSKALIADGSTFCRRLVGYDASKLAMLSHVKELSRRLGGSGVTANCLHPGVVYTNLWRQYLPDSPMFLQKIVIFCMRPLFVTARQAAQTTIYCSVASELTHVTGKYFRRCRVSRESSMSRDPLLAAQLWHVSMLLTGCRANGQCTIPRLIVRHRNIFDNNSCSADRDGGDDAQQRGQCSVFTVDTVCGQIERT